ncbi:MAG: hypothetical protein I8H71_00295 [Xanthomonadaceae bacterium]|nr:hypothetical protein [Xanthomonadaceae bacterium]MBH2008112.1 hypothetical protein [Xanthomonadaceae bacterium]
MSETQELANQGAWTAGRHLREAIKTIDAAFEEPGYAKAHPELVAAFMRTAAADFSAVVLGNALISISEALG